MTKKHTGQAVIYVIGSGGTLVLFHRSQIGKSNVLERFRATMKTGPYFRTVEIPIFVGVVVVVDFCSNKPIAQVFKRIDLIRPIHSYLYCYAVRFERKNPQNIWPDGVISLHFFLVMASETS